MKRTLLALLLCFSVGVFAQSPWTQKKGKAYTQLSFTTIPGYEKLYGKRDISTERKITDNTLRFYGEYGISNKTSVFAAIPLKSLKANQLVDPNDTNIQTSGGKLNYVGNILIGLKHNFYKKKWLITGQLNIETNTQKTKNVAGLSTGYDAWTITPLLIVGKSTEKFYIQAYGGADIRTNNYSSAIKLGGEMGYQIVKSVWLAGFADGVASLANGTVVLPDSRMLTALYVDKQSYAAFGLKPRFEVNEEFGVNLAAAIALAGRRVPKQAVITLGIYYKFL